MRASRKGSKVTTRSPKYQARSGGESFASRFAGLHLEFTADDLLEALQDLQRNDPGVAPSDVDQGYWVAHSGIELSSRVVARSSAVNAAARILMDASSLTAAEVGENLHLAKTTVRRHRAERKLYAYLVNGRLVFPAWQFTRTGDRVLPGMERILAVLPNDLHPQTVAGFFRTPQPDLILNGEATAVALWLEEGGSVEPVLALATSMNNGY
ncbi:hypothetical protein ACP3TD_11580 [Pseudarthrobacter sp. 1G09]|uniref:hypothetical protein n=1 Tax=Pseudarthrobacter sp. 1G09 TaxID=3416178 RepID=UPI003CE84830